MIKKIHTDFPAYVIPQFDPLTEQEKQHAISLVQTNYKNKIDNDYKPWAFDIFKGDNKELFDFIYDALIQKVSEYIPFSINSRAFETKTKHQTIFVSYSTKDHNMAEYDCNGQGLYHNHKHNRLLFNQPVDVSIIYYLYVSNDEGGNIDFRKETVFYPNGTSEQTIENEEYHKYNHRKKFFMKEKTTFIQEAISYQPAEGDIIILPQTLDHRVGEVTGDGERIALVLQIPTNESGQDILKNLEGQVNSNEKTT